MYYLKCNHCGHANELKTEFLTFCNQCGKKLSANFQEWSKEHPGASFDDYKKMVGTTDLQVLKEGPFQKKKKFPIIAGVLVGVAFMGLFTYYMTNMSGVSILSLLRSGKTPDSIIQSKWERYNFGRFGLSLEAPVKPEMVELAIPDEVKQQIKEMETFQYAPLKGFEMMVSSVLYSEGITASLEGAANGSLNEIVKKPGVSNFEFKDSPVTYNEVNGVLINGSFHLNGVFMRFSTVIYTRNSHMWQVLVSWQDQDANGKIAAERILDSVEINYYVKTI